MTKEREEQPSTNQAGLTESQTTQFEGGPYAVAEAIFNLRVEQLKESGLLRRVPEITCEEELDDHFDDLTRVYRQVYFELGLPWPPPVI
jgi:hypothetical protein